MVGDDENKSYEIRLRDGAPLEPQAHFGDKCAKFQVVCPPNGTAALKGLIPAGAFCYILCLLVEVHWGWGYIVYMHVIQ